MNIARVPSKILGADGRPAAYNLYPSPRSNPRAYKPRRWLSGKTRLDVSEFDRQEMVSLSRQLRAQIDTLDSAIRQKNSWAFGDAWDPHFCGENKDWGDEVSAWLSDVWMPNCNVRGPQYPFKVTMRLSGEAWDIDGDDAMVFTQSDSGFPMIAVFPAPKIANYGAGSKISQRIYAGQRVSGGPYDGARMYDGVILDRNGRIIALRIVGDDDEAQDIPAASADLAYEPTWCDQCRGIPRIATSLLKWMNLQEIDDFLQRGIKRASSIGLIQKTEDGEAPGGSGIESEADPNSIVEGAEIHYQEIHGGEMYYLSAPAGESIEGLNYQNPHPNTEAYIERVTRSALASVGWFRELLDLSTTGRAPARILVDMANQSIWDRQSTGERRWRRAINYAVARGMKIGAIPRNEDGMDAYKWTPGLPKPLSVDAGNEAQAAREDLKLGITTKAILAQKQHGRHYEEIDHQRDIEIRQQIARAKALIQEHPELTFDRAMELYEQRSPNPVLAPQQRPGQPAGAPAGQRAGAKPRGRAVSFRRAPDGTLIGADIVEESEPSPK